MKTYEIMEGISGKGTTNYLLYTFKDGLVKHIEIFSNREEAELWIKYSV